MKQLIRDVLKIDVTPSPSLIYNFDNQESDDELNNIFNTEAIKAIGNLTARPILLDVRVPVHEDPVCEYIYCIKSM